MVPRFIASPGRTLIRMPPCPIATEAACAKTCNPARLRDRGNIEAPPPHPERSEWAIGRLRRARPARTGALSAAFGTAARRGRIAATDIRASAQLGAEAPRAGEDSAGVAAVCGAVVVEAVAAAVAGAGRSEGEPWQE